MSSLALSAQESVCTLDRIHPARSPAFSPNLHHWLRRHMPHFGLPAAKTLIDYQIYAVRAGSTLVRRHYFGEGELLIGAPYTDDGSSDFCGAMLLHVLAHGTAAEPMCYPGIMPSLELVNGFWSNYLRIGRCAIDPLHTIHFRGPERYDLSGDDRICRWCGIKQRRVINTQTIIVDHEQWVRYG